VVSAETNSITLFADDDEIATFQGLTSLNLAKVVFIPETGSVPPLPAEPGTGTPENPSPGILTGTAGNDFLTGDENTRSIFGLEGDDQLDSGPSTDFIDAGPGNDSVLVVSPNLNVLGGAGDDEIVAFAAFSDIAGDAGNDTIRGNFSDSFVRGGEGNDLITSTGGNNALFGDDGNDAISGTTADEMQGGAGDDALYSISAGTEEPFTRGAAFMFGGPGADLLVSNGSDEMTGGTEADQFRFINWFDDFRGPFVESVITDFNPQQDVIEIVLVGNAPIPILGTETSPIDGNVALLANGVRIVEFQGLASFDTSRVVFVAPDDALERV